MSSVIRSLSLFYQRLLRMHPAERGRDLWFQEEARAERLSNFIRIIYTFAWLISTVLHAPGNLFWSNMSNLGWGGIWFVWSLGFQIWLIYRPYRPGYKFLTTSVDMFVITAMIFTYQLGAGPVYALKVPTFYTYFCCVGLAALRFRRSLVLFGVMLALGLHLLLFLYFNLRYDISYGSGMDHTFTSKVSFLYLAYQDIYLVIFGFLTYVIAVNVHRLVELRAREAESSHRARERAVVAAGVAHEIKNPLEGIYGAAQLLQEEGKGNSRFIEMILKDSVRLNDVVQNFLRFSRPFAPKMESFDLAALIRDFCRVQSELIPETPVEFSAGVDSFPILSDAEGLRIIFRNLLQNARRFQPKSAGPVLVGLDGGEEVAEVWFEDAGEGVSEDQRGNLFEPFFTTSAKGTGLGLAISRKIARELGGDLYYEALEPGSRFTLVVKARKEDAN